ncbi:MAG TPA: glycosyltransferase, partial [Burkholderiales bacterium]|nr:glycosyltransferase [Burkholderiales bacterium]
LFGVVSRLTYQKGLDLLMQSEAELLDMPVQLAMLGSGEKALEAAFADLARRHPRRVAVTIGFDEGLAHLVEAGADCFLMPSRFEPCGLNQMYSLAYGTPPVVRATGGLADTVIDLPPGSAQAGKANGFVFSAATALALAEAMSRALAAWRQPLLWRQLQANGMRARFDWQAPAGQYVEIYRRLGHPVAG